MASAVAQAAALPQQSLKLQNAKDRQASGTDDPGTTMSGLRHALDQLEAAAS